MDLFKHVATLFAAILIQRHGRIPHSVLLEKAGSGVILRRWLGVAGEPHRVRRSGAATCKLGRHRRSGVAKAHQSHLSHSIDGSQGFHQCLGDVALDLQDGERHAVRTWV